MAMGKAQTRLAGDVAVIQATDNLRRDADTWILFYTRPLVVLESRDLMAPPADTRIHRDMMIHAFAQVSVNRWK